ncbi:MAG: hypothetical protein HN961_08385 [Planctomycetes bacterium]|nr:hypothetical protein [Planctomycetota bacterium]
MAEPGTPPRPKRRWLDFALWGFVLWMLYGFFFGASDLKLGQTAPELRVGSWVRPPVASSLAELRGRVVFLEFWSST